MTAAPPVVGVNDSADRTAKLRLWLQMTVPLEMQRLATASPAVLATLAHAAPQEIAEHGDDLEFGGQFTARAVAALARALASAALTCPGGATFLGLHWCFDHSACREAERAGHVPRGDGLAASAHL